jgi:hypothetical protein
MTQTDDFVEGYKAGYQVGYQDGKGAGYVDAKVRAHLAVEAALERPALNQARRALDNVVGKAE